MFWRFNYLTSEIDTLLDKEDVTLQDILNEEDVLQECKSQNKKLVDFLVLPEHFEQLVNMVIKEPSSDTEERLRYKFPNIACELITSDVNQITDALAENMALLVKLVDFLDTDEPLNPLQASFFSKVMGLLITRKSELTLGFLKSRESFINHVLHHLDTSAVMDLLLRLITSMESQECKNSCVAWLSEQQVIQKLIRLLNHSQSSETHSNVAQSLSDIIRISREQVTQYLDQSIPDTLLVTIESEEVVSMLLDQMFSCEKTETILTNGLSILQTLMEFRRSSIDGQMEVPTSQEIEKMTQSVSSTLKAIVPRLKDFHLLLHEPPKQHYLPMPTTLGTLGQPLGNTRLQTVRLIAFLLAANNPAVNEELARLGTLNSILNLYFEYAWNNFLHTQVEQCITAILKNESTGSDHVLLSQLIKECRLLERIVDAFDENQCQESKVGSHRRGYLGHLTRISNSIVNNKVSIQNSQTIEELVQGLAEDLRKRWNAFVLGTLAELNKQNSTEFLCGNVSAPSSVDTDSEFRDITFPQEVNMQKVGRTSRLLGFTGDEQDEEQDDGSCFNQENPFGMKEAEEEGDSSKDSSDSEEDLDSPWQIHQVPESSARKMDTVEDMDITTDDVSPVITQSPWDTSAEVKIGQDPSTEQGGWAQFETVTSSRDSGGENWANFSPASSVGQDDASGKGSETSQVSGIRSPAYAASNDGATDCSRVADGAPNQSSGAVTDPMNAITSSSVSSSSSPQPVFSSTVENGPA